MKVIRKLVFLSAVFFIGYFSTAKNGENTVQSSVADSVKWDTIVVYPTVVYDSSHVVTILYPIIIIDSVKK